MEFFKLSKGSSAVSVIGNIGFFKFDSETTSLVYTLSSDGTYYIVGTGFTNIDSINSNTSGGTAGSGLDSTWAGGQLVIPAKHNGLPVRAIAPRAFMDIKNITKAFISDSVTTIGDRAFTCAVENGFDTTMTFIKFPNKLLTWGGVENNTSAGRILWGRQALKDVVVNFGNVTQGINMYCPFANVKAKSVTLNCDVEVPLRTYYSYMFYNAEVDKIVFGQGFKTFYDNSITAIASNMFNGAKVGEIHFNEATSFGTYGNNSNIFTTTSVINKIYFHNISSFTYFTGTSSYKPFTNLKNCKIFIETKTPSMTSSDIFTEAINNSNKIFFNKNYIEDFYTATNWTVLFKNNYQEETGMFVYGDFNKGESLPQQIGGYEKYNVSWYIDDDFTTLATQEITKATRLYGKLTYVGSVVDVKTHFASSTAETTHSVSCNVGDTLIAYFNTRSSYVEPDGWTKLCESGEIYDDNNTYSQTTYVYTKVATQTTESITVKTTNSESKYVTIANIKDKTIKIVEDLTKVNNITYGTQLTVVNPTDNVFLYCFGNIYAFSDRASWTVAGSYNKYITNQSPYSERLNVIVSTKGKNSQFAIQSNMSGTRGICSIALELV